MPLIRDTIDPLNEREVSDEEALDLDRMGIRLTGTRAKTPDGLRAAAVRQVLENEAAKFAAPSPDRPVPPAVDAEDDQDDDDHQDGDDRELDELDEESQDPGVAPVSTTDDTPTRTNQES